MSLFSDANETWYERLLEKCMLKFCTKNYEQEYRSSEKRNCSDLLCIKMWTTMNNDKNITHHILTKKHKICCFHYPFLVNFNFVFLLFSLSQHIMCVRRVQCMCECVFSCVLVVDFQDLRAFSRCTFHHYIVCSKCFGVQSFLISLRSLFNFVTIYCKTGKWVLLFSRSMSSPPPGIVVWRPNLDRLWILCFKHCDVKEENQVFFIHSIFIRVAQNYSRGCWGHIPFCLYYFHFFFSRSSLGHEFGFVMDALILLTGLRWKFIANAKIATAWFISVIIIFIMLDCCPAKILSKTTLSVWFVSSWSYLESGFKTFSHAIR